MDEIVSSQLCHFITLEPIGFYIVLILINTNPCFMIIHYYYCVSLIISMWPPHLLQPLPALTKLRLKVISPSLLKWLHIHRRWKYSLPWTEGSGGESYNGWEESGRWSEKIQRAQGWRRWRREIKGRWTEDMNEMGGIRRENANHLLLSPSHLSLSSPPRQHSLPCSISLFLYVFLHCCPFSFPSLHSFLL